ncbi:PGAP1-domain-containing protein [Ceraceosorus guamensis]|uniref:GPI inositol-deacylase n=1 Tax=Ceraceosorus guamensis TaxID=1522189 RepID=A0A316W628_9BASI|nr:PGAP1-domain-containing protein [Ceraceosorus guamensis]PWN45114.1 PGAP1-domain-containing protein [Ceraceosorus guamensis]
MAAPAAGRRSSLDHRIWLVLVLFIAALVDVAFVRSFLTLPSALCISQRCRMSRMWPSYIQYKVPSPSGLSAKYSLYLYRERGPDGLPWTEQASEPKGRPALFIPGNSGSHGQVRSVGSWGYQEWRDGEWRGDVSKGKEVDWWTIDFNEDFSAFHGPTLMEQAVYVNEVLSYLSSYFPKQPILLLGHSMGGVVARLSLLQPNHPVADSAGAPIVDTIVTLSSPHVYPPVPLDDSIESLYAPLRHQSLAAHANATPPLLISISGGLLDTQLPAEPSSLSLSDFWPARARLDSFTSNMPALWSSVDHLAMMWCDQLRRKVARGALLDTDASSSRSSEQGLSRRRELWRRVIGLAPDTFSDVELLAHLPPAILRSSMTGSEDRDTLLYTVPVALNSEQYPDFDLLTTLSVGADPSSFRPMQQDADLEVELCKKDLAQPGGAGLNCQRLPSSAYGLLPPSPIASHEESDQCPPPFPAAETHYEIPGVGTTHLSLSGSLLKSEKIDAVRIRRAQSEQEKGWWRAGWAFKSQAHSDGTLPLASLTNTLQSGAQSGASIQSPVLRAAFPALFDNSLLAFKLTFTLSSRCSQGSMSFAPFARVLNPVTGDAAWFASLWSSSQLTLERKFALHGSSPFINSPQRGLQLEVFYDQNGCDSKQTAGALGPFEEVKTYTDWKASAGLLLMRYRLAAVTWPLAILLWTAAGMWSDRESDLPSLLSRLASVRHSGLFPLMVTTAFLSSAQQILFRIFPHRTGHAAILDLSLGLGHFPIAYSLVLGPALLLLSHSACLVVAVLSWCCIAISARLARASRVHRRLDWGPAPSSKVTIKKRSWIGVAVLGVSVILLLPYQFAFLASTLLVGFAACRSHATQVQLQRDKSAPQSASALASGSAIEGSTRGDGTAESSIHSHSQERARQHFLLLNILLWLLPLKAPVLLVWARNLGAGWVAPLGGPDHNVLRVAPVLILAQIITSGRSIERGWAW